MKVKAAVSFGAGEPLKVETVQLEGPRAGAVLVEMKSTGVCHTDEYTRSGSGVTSVFAGDHVIPLYTPECRQCKSCLSRKTNLCTAIRATQGQGLMPDGTTRLSLNGEPLYQLPPRFHERVTGEDMASLEDRIIGVLVDK